jgi:hypothetical protein
MTAVGQTRATLALNTRPAQAGVTCPRDWRAAAGWETATGPAPGHAQPGRSDRKLTPASGKGAGVCLRPSQAVRTIPVAR